MEENVLQRLRHKLGYKISNIHPSYLQSYAQCGEDLIIKFLFENLGIKHPRYVDIGAHHPYQLSNTYLFYKQGSSGVCIEPDLKIYKLLKYKRGRDECLNVGIGTRKLQKANYFIMTSGVLNTFLENEANNYESSDNYGEQKIESVIKVPLMTINDLNRKYFKKNPHLYSIDTEGMDYDILRSFDFTRYRPTVFCVETIRRTGPKSVKKNYQLISFMKSVGYTIFADTFINTIFVDKKTLTIHNLII